VDSAVVDAVYLERKDTRPSGAAGTLYWDSNPQSGLSFIPTTNEGNIDTTINVGQQSLIYVHNLTGETVVSGTAVYISGTAHGEHPSITKAKADNAATARAVGLATTTMVDNSHGYVTVLGLVKNINTGGMTTGSAVYLSKDSAGKYTTTPVTVQSGYPFHIGTIVRADSNTGSILVNPFSEHYEYLKIQDDLVVAGLTHTSTLSIDSSLIMTPIDHMARPAWYESKMWYDQDGKTYAFHTADSDYIQFVGEREFVRGRNSSGSMIPKGTPVYTSGVHISGDPIHGHHPLIYPANAATDGQFEVIGITSHNIQNGQHGYVITRGWIADVNTIGLVSGQRFHLAPAGGFQLAAPAYPNYPVDLGIALSIDSTAGSIYVNVKDHTLEQIRSTGDARVDGDLTVGGNLNVVGTTTSTSLQQIQVSSNFLKLLEGNTLATSYVNDSPSGLNDAVFIGSYRGDSDLYYFIDMVSTDSTGDIIRFGISSTPTIVEGQYGVPFDSASSGKTTWNLSTNGLTAPLRNNISIQFTNATGHSDSDLWTSHPTSLNLDLGFVGNYNPAGAGGIRYAGVYRDVNDSRWKFFEGLNQTLDSSIVTISDSNGFTLSNVQANTFYGALSGNATTATSATQLANVRTFTIAGDVTASAQNFDGTGNVTLTTNIATGVIVNADISATAAIEDTKLATISTAGKVQNSATTATNANTGSAIVARDVSGNFSAGTITAALSGNATTATTLQTARTIGDVSFNGGAAIVPERIVYKDTRAVNHNPYTYPGVTLHLKTNTTDGLADGGTYHGVLDLQHWSDSSGGVDHQLGLTQNGNIYIRNSTNATTWSSWLKLYDSADATSTNTGSKLVTRDASGNFAAGTITAALSGNATTATTLQTARDFSITGDITATAVSFNGSGNVALSAAINAGAVDSAALGALSVSSAKLQASIPDSKLATISTAGKVSNSATTATNANTASAIVARDASGNFTAGTITAALTGNASTATTLQTARTIAISGDVTGTATSFNGGANISISSTITAGSIVSADFNTATSLIIYNSAGTALKTIYSPGS